HDGHTTLLPLRVPLGGVGVRGGAGGAVTRVFAEGARTLTDAGRGAAPVASTARARATQPAWRRPGSFSSARSTASITARGNFGISSPSDGAGRVVWATNSAGPLASSKGGRPASSSKSRTPSAYWSAAPS